MSGRRDRPGLPGVPRSGRGRSRSGASPEPEARRQPAVVRAVEIRGKAALGGTEHGNPTHRGERDRPGAAHSRLVPLDPAAAGHHLHGDDRQPAVRLDALRQPDLGQIRVDQGLDPGGLHDLRAAGDVARARRRLSRRQVRAASRRAGRRPHVRHRLGDELLRQLAPAALRGGRGERARGRRGLRHLRGQRAQVVSRSARACGRPHRRRVRRGLRADRAADPGDHQVDGLRDRLPVLRHRPGHRGHDRCACADRSPARGQPRRRAPGDQGAEAADPADQARLPADGDRARAGVLDHVPHVRDGRGRRAHGRRAARPDRQGLQGCRHSGEPRSGSRCPRSPSH